MMSRKVGRPRIYEYGELDRPKLTRHSACELLTKLQMIQKLALEHDRGRNFDARLTAHLRREIEDTNCMISKNEVHQYLVQTEQYLDQEIRKIKEPLLAARATTVISHEIRSFINDSRKKSTESLQQIKTELQMALLEVSASLKMQAIYNEDESRKRVQIVCVFDQIEQDETHKRRRLVSDEHPMIIPLADNVQFADNVQQILEDEDDDELD